MRRYSIFFAAALGVIASIGHAVAAIAIAAIEAIASPLADKPMLALAGDLDARQFGGFALEPALQQELRHESGVPRQAAARNV